MIPTRISRAARPSPPHSQPQSTFPSLLRGTTNPTPNSSTNNDEHSISVNANDNTAHPTPPNLPLHPFRHLATTRQRRRRARDPTPTSRSTRAVLRRHALPRLPRRTQRDRLGRRVRHSRQRPKVKKVPPFLPLMAFYLFYLFFFVVFFFFGGGSLCFRVGFRDFCRWADCCHDRDAASVIAAIAVANGSARLSVLKESPFLPSISGESRKIF